MVCWSSTFLHPLIKAASCCGGAARAGQRAAGRGLLPLAVKMTVLAVGMEALTVASLVASALAFQGLAVMDLSLSCLCLELMFAENHRAYLCLCGACHRRALHGVRRALHGVRRAVVESVALSATRSEGLSSAEF